MRIPVGHVGLEALLVSVKHFRQHMCWQLQYVLIMTLVACFSVGEDCGTARCSFTGNSWHYDHDVCVYLFEPGLDCFICN